MALTYPFLSFLSRRIVHLLEATVRMQENISFDPLLAQKKVLLPVVAASLKRIFTTSVEVGVIPVTTYPLALPFMAFSAV